MSLTWLRSATLAVILAGCGDGGVPGAPLTGDLAGTFDGLPFQPFYGIARDLDPPNDAQGKLEIQVSEVAVSCTRFLTATSYAGLGVYARVYAAEPVVGPAAARPVVMSRMGRSGNVITSVKSVSSSSATLTLTAVESGNVAGTITYDSGVENGAFTLDGSFSVQRCP